MTPKPTSVSSAPGSLVVALTSRRERDTRHVAVTPLNVSMGLGLATTATVVIAADVAHVPGSDQGEQLLTSTRNLSVVPAGTLLPFTNVSIGNVIRGRSCGVPKATATGAMRDGSVYFSGLPLASTCHHVNVSGIGDGVVVSRLPDASSVMTVPGVTSCDGP